MLKIPESVLDDAALDETGDEGLLLELSVDGWMELVPLVIDKLVPESPSVVEADRLPDKLKLEEEVDGNARTEPEDDVDN